MLLITWLWALLPVAAETTGNGEPTAHIKEMSYGTIQGRLVPLGIKDLPAVEQYLSVPYGVAPEGIRRFEPPQSARKWGSRHAHDGTKMPPVCIQNFPDLNNQKDLLDLMPKERYDFIRKIKEAVKNQREDCLYMNIYVPHVPEPNGQHSFPIIVIVHGESFEWNTGNIYDGTLLASYGMTMVVTLNYRLGAHGFLSSGDQVLSGNRALLDILAALHMLHSIAPDFYGDPTRITLLGFGSGAVLVNLLMTAPPSFPANQQLFHRAILLGGSALSKWGLVENPRDFFYIFADKAGCPIVTDKRSDDFLLPDEVLDCLSRQSLENITRAQQLMPHNSFLTTFGPVVDGIFVVRQPLLNLKHHGGLFHRYDLMLGVGRYEAFNHLSDGDITDGVDPERKDRIFRTLARNYYQFHLSEIFEAISYEYTNTSTSILFPSVLREDVLSALNDCLYVAPMLQTAKLHTTNDPTPLSSTWLYLFNYYHQAKNPGTVEDLPYILGYPFVKPGQLNLPYGPFSQRDKLMSEVMMRYISNYAKSGNPNGPLEPGDFVIESNVKLAEKLKKEKWGPFGGGNDQYFTISEKPRMGQFYRSHQVSFWTKFLPKLNQPLVGDGHDLLARHYELDSYFGQVAPMGGYFSGPHTLPPVITPAATDETSSTRAQDVTKVTSTLSPGELPAVANYSTILSITVAVGCALLVLNILVFAGIYHQRDKQNRRKKQQIQLQYETYDGSAAYLGSPMTQGAGHMPPPPPPPVSLNPLSPVMIADGGDLHSTVSSQLTTFQQDNNVAASKLVHNNHVQHEQEPLINRTVSPLCPRHGIRAMTAQRGAMDEIQV